VIEKQRLLRQLGGDGRRGSTSGTACRTPLVSNNSFFTNQTWYRGSIRNYQGEVMARFFWGGGQGRGGWSSSTKTVDQPSTAVWCLSPRFTGPNLVRNTSLYTRHPFGGSIEYGYWPRTSRNTDSDDKNVIAESHPT